MDKTLNLIKKALKSDVLFKKCSLTEPIDILWDAYHSNCEMFDKMVEELKKIEATWKP